MDPAMLEAFFGVPVVVQLRFPLAAVMMGDKGKLPYADRPSESRHIPLPFMENGSPSGTQLIAYAVLHRLEGSLLEMIWSSLPGDPPPGAIIGHVATIATLLDAKDIVAVTRIVSVPDTSPLILSAR
jgi:hypothetical protein